MSAAYAVLEQAGPICARRRDRDLGTVAAMFTLYENAVSGNCYKVRLAAAQLGVALRRVEVDIPSGGTRTPEFLARNPIGKVPTLELEPGVSLPESNAILCYLAEGSALLPADRLARARVMQWLFFEQYSHEPYIAVIRAWRAFFGIPAGREAEVPMREARGYEALAILDGELAQRRFIAGDAYTIADIALYAYTHVAHQGGFELARYPAVRAWLERVAAQPGHITIEA
jgi:glutathione S-transferase